MQSITYKIDGLPLISMNFEVKSSIEEKVLLSRVAHDGKGVIDVKCSNIRLQIFELALSNPNQGVRRFVKPESSYLTSNI